MNIQQDASEVVSSSAATGRSAKKTRFIRVKTPVVAKYIRPEPVLDRATAYLGGHERHEKKFKGVKGVYSSRLILSKMKKIRLSNEKIERKKAEIEVERLKQSIQTADLDEMVRSNLKIARAYLSEKEYRDIRGS